MKRVFSWLLLVQMSLTLGAQVLPEQKSTLDDMERLAARQVWAEMVMRLPDVEAAGRGARWETLVEKAAEGYLNSFEQDGMTGAENVVIDLVQKKG